MRRVVPLLLLAACGPKSKPATSAPPLQDPGEPPPPALPAVVLFGAPGGALLPIVCGGDVEGVSGGVTCLDDVLPAAQARSGLAAGGAAAGCTDARGLVQGFVEVPVDGEPVHIYGLLELAAVGHAALTAVRTPATDPRDKVEHELDLDGNGEPEHVTLIPHDNRSSYGRSLTIVDGHDPLMSDTYDPFPDAADLLVLGTSDVDGDRRRELVLYAPDPDGFGVVVLEYWASGEAYRLDCRTP